MTPALLANTIQRYIGLTAFVFLFVQLIIGVSIDKLAAKFGHSIFKYHIIQGIFTFILAFLHPLIFMVFNHFINSKWDPYAVFVNACVICKEPINYYYTLGMISFWLLFISTFIALFRHHNDWFRKYWKKFHLLNYIVFLIVGVHGFLLGTDFSVKPFVYFAIPAYLIIIGIIIFHEIPKQYRKLKGWLED